MKKGEPHLSKVALTDELTSVPDLIGLVQFFQRGACPRCYVHHALNHRFRAAAERISHCCTGNAQPRLKNNNKQLIALHK